MTGRMQAQDEPFLPDPPRAVPEWFFLRRMRAVFFCGVLLTGLGLLLGLGLPVFFFLLGGRVWPTVDLALDRDHATATGRVVATECQYRVHFGSRHPWKVVFTLVTDDGTEAVATGYTLDPAFERLQPGDTIPVEHDPADPWRARPAGGTVSLIPLWLYLLILGLIGVPHGGVGLVLLAVGGTRARRERLLLVHGAAAPAEVLQVREVTYIHFGRRHPYDVYYRFTDHRGHEVTGKDRTYHYEWAERLQPGDRVGVTYNPVTPTCNVLWLHGGDAAATGREYAAGVSRPGDETGSW